MALLVFISLLGIIINSFQEILKFCTENAKGNRYTLPKCPSGHSILHRGLKLNSKISAGKYKKLNSPGQVDFHRGAKQKLCLQNTEIP